MPAAPAMPPGAPVVIVLAAGQGRRFRSSGGRMHKLDAPLRLEGDAGAARVVRALRGQGSVRELRLDDDPGIVMDVDTVDDLARAQALLCARGGWEREEFQEEAHGEH